MQKIFGMVMLLVGATALPAAATVNGLASFPVLQSPAQSLGRPGPSPEIPGARLRIRGPDREINQPAPSATGGSG